jgi:hypothetical protein
MLKHLVKSHKYDFEFPHKVPLRDLQEGFTVVAIREEAVIQQLLAVSPWERASFWKAQRTHVISGLSNGEFKLFLNLTRQAYPF